MTTEDDFHRALDAEPEDWQTRLVFAGWLQDRGDPRAAGYRAIAILQRHPLKGQHKNTETWWWHVRSHAATGEDLYNVIPADWFELLPPGDGGAGFWPVFSAKGGIKSRRECEDALALAFSKLSADRQAELLTPPKTSKKSRKGKGE